MNKRVSVREREIKRKSIPNEVNNFNTTTSTRNQIESILQYSNFESFHIE